MLRSLEHGNCIILNRFFISRVVFVIDEKRVFFWMVWRSGGRVARAVPFFAQSNLWRFGGPSPYLPTYSVIPFEKLSLP